MYGIVWGDGGDLRDPMGGRMSKVSSDFQFEMMLLMRHLNHLQRHAEWEQAPLDRSAYILMTRMYLDGPLTIRELRDALGLDDSTLNRQTAAVVRSGFVERIPDPDGGVARKFRLTDVGQQRLIDERQAYVDELSHALTAWNDTQVDDLATSLRAFNEAFEAAEGRPWNRPES